MGYTHYFELSGEKKKNVDLERLQERVQKVLDANKDIVQFEEDVKKPAVNEVKDGRILIRFNGIGDQGGHETFYFDSSEIDYTYCKTARKPYDLVVCIVLLIIKDHFGTQLDLTSDGFSNNQPKDHKYKVGDAVRFDHVDENWGEAMSWFIDDVYGEEISNAFIVEGTHGDNDCYFKVKLNETIFNVAQTLVK